MSRPSEYETPEYFAFLMECAKYCRCKNDICDGVLAGGLCDEIGVNEHADDTE